MFLATQAQTAEEVVDEFFTALSAKDTRAIDRLTLDDMQLHSLSLGEDRLLSSSTKAKFLEGLNAIPESVIIQERIFNISSISTEYLAQFQVPYEFYVNGKLSHSGTNVLTLIKTKDAWRISYIADTRKK